MDGKAEAIGLYLPNLPKLGPGGERGDVSEIRGIKLLRKSRGTYPHRSQSQFWFFLAAILVFLS